MKLYVLFDAAVQRAVGGPMMFHTDEEARRTALHAACDPKTLVNQSPDDYVLYRVAEFDTESCQVVGHDLQPVVSSSEFLSAVRQFQRSQAQHDEE